MAGEGSTVLNLESRSQRAPAKVLDERSDPQRSTGTEHVPTGQKRMCGRHGASSQEDATEQKGEGGSLREEGPGAWTPGSEG